jgi:activating signal cointegrator complex subunit 3
LESIVARTLREVEISQRMIRIVGLSATLPNYADVAAFLRVNPYRGMFFFDDSFRPIPLTQQFIGVKGKRGGAVAVETNRIALQKTLKFLENQHQVMVFVHSRNETTKGAWAMIDLAAEAGMKAEFALGSEKPSQAARLEVNKSRNKDVKELFAKGFGVHHAGMLRSDRLLTEKLFMDGHIRVLFCTATLAWGVNLPAHAVIIKGTQVYDAERGEWGNLGILDVLQIFGRAGRPQFEAHGEGIIITGHDKLFHYLNAIMCQTPIESQFIKRLPDNLNAEIALGTVSNKQEAIAWLGYTYLNVRMRRNPLAYGLTPKEVAADPFLQAKMESIVSDVAKKLKGCGMITFDAPEREGFMRCRQVGRLASLFYLGYETIEHFGSCMNPRMSEEDILAMVASCSEFESIKVREEELEELGELMEMAPMSIRGDWTSPGAKVSLLIQLYISRHDPYSFSLQSDLNTLRQSVGRVLRAVFEIFRSQEWAQCALRALKLCLAVQHRVWPVEHALAQFDSIPRQVCKVLHDRGMNDLCDLRESFDAREIAQISGQSTRIGPIIRSALLQFPRVQMSVTCQPVLPTVLALRVAFCIDFAWNERVHGSGSDKWWLWVEDESHLLMKHCELVNLTRDQIGLQKQTEFYLAIDPKDPPSQLFCRFVSDRWLHASEIYSLPLRFYSNLLLTEAGQKEAAKQHTDLLALQPLPIAALGERSLQSLYKFAFFNAVQTQCFHSLFHGAQSILIGAPTGSGKTVLAELAMWRALRSEPHKKIVYIAPLKALVKERLQDWRPRLWEALKLSVVELTGDYAPDQSVLLKANLILTTPEKWDSVSRNQQGKAFVSAVGLVICDEIHLLGGDRGHVLEMIVSRMRRIGAGRCRFVGLSTAMANAEDLSIWLSGSAVSSSPSNFFTCFNFRPSVRPVPLQVFLEGYADLHYCPRMASMNKPLYTHILNLSPDRPVLVFVSSRRQTRLTAQALISFCVNDDRPRRFLFEDDVLKEAQLAALIDRVVYTILRHTLYF